MFFIQLFGEIDLNIYNYFLNNKNDYIYFFFYLITYLGKFYIVFIFAILFLIFLIKESKKIWILPVLTSLIISASTTLLLKYIIQRPRPINELLIQDNFSFPSGHATIAVAFYAMLLLFLYKNLKNKIHKNISLGIGLFIIFAIGFSRIYLDVHYFSDVLVGYLVGFIGFYLSYKLLIFLQKIN